MLPTGRMAVVPAATAAVIQPPQQQHIDWAADALPWWSRYASQLHALVRKNYILLARHWKVRARRAGVRAG